MSFFETFDLAEIKSRLNLEEIVGRYVTLKPVGDRLMAPCPFHQETKASFSITPDRTFFYCFGCQAKGDVIEFYKNINGLDFAETVTQLAEEAGIKLKKKSRIESGDEESSHSVCRQVISLSTSFFIKCLQSPEGKQARAYLQERQIDSRTAEKFDLGWSPEGWNKLKNFLEKSGLSAQKGVLAGVLSQNQEGRIFDRFRARLIFPIHALSGMAAAFGGRVIDDGQPKYINSSESPVYTKGEHLYGLYQARQNIARSRRALLTEGYLDVLALHQYGFENSCGILGTALTRFQVKRLSGMTREVVLLFDGDPAGQNAALKSAEMILKAGLTCRVLIFPEADDAHSLLCRKGPEALEKLLQNTKDGLDFCLGMLTNHKAPKEIMIWVENFIMDIDDLSWRSYYIPRVAHSLGMSEKEIRQKFDRKTNPGRQTSAGLAPGKATEQRDRELLAFAVCYPEYRARLKQKNLDLVLYSDWAKSFWDKLWPMQEDGLSGLNPDEADFFVNSKMRMHDFLGDKSIVLDQVEEFIDRCMSKMSKENLKMALARAQHNKDSDEIRRILGLLQKSF